MTKMSLKTIGLAALLAAACLVLHCAGDPGANLVPLDLNAMCYRNSRVMVEHKYDPQSKDDDTRRIHNDI
ncbi:hypothetical protein EVAR_81905_1 [Eumeta japonica]|uniref:Uncharacterized protein n=1 Tax=Eumeta variegata TaxID=151549 RepID=A0A4C1UYB2_EUMVA|nr:hypothetical protein EVAR_81905_1 [Eumeta japonica]